MPDFLEGDLMALECRGIQGRRSNGSTNYIFDPIGLICVPPALNLLSEYR
jgi:hypothetical protein